MPVIALADHGVRDRIKEPGFLGAGAFIEISRILLEKGGEDRISKECSRNEVRIGGAEAFRVALGSLSIPAERVVGLLNSGKCRGNSEEERVDCELPTELKFLAGVERSGIRNITDVVVRNHAEDALLFFEMDLICSDLLACLCHVDFDGRSHYKLDGGDDFLLPCLKDARLMLSGEAGRGDREVIGPGGNVFECKTSIAPRNRLQTERPFREDNGSVRDFCA